MAANDPRHILDEGRMSVRQWIVVAIMIALNALDGFDVLSSAFAGPGIRKEWGVSPAELGVVLSAELVGMGVGSVLLGGMADKFGRRPAMLLCLAIMAAGMWLATTSTAPMILATWRLITGLGIGGMLAAINAVTAEYSNKKARSVAMSLMVIGYPLGATLGGIVAAWLLRDGEWRLVFEFGAICTAVCIPLVYFLVPETIDYLNQHRPANALTRINKTLKLMGHPQIEDLPPVPAEKARTSVFDILKPGLVGTTLTLTAAYLFHCITFYFTLKYSPTIVGDFGYSQSQAAQALVWANVGGATGGFIFGFFMQRFGIKGPTVIMLLASVVAVAAFGLGQTTLTGWYIAVFLTGITTNSAIVGCYAAFARGFPTHVRATGTGFVIGAGRIGAVGSPLLAGALFQSFGGYQEGLFVTACIMAVGSAIGAIAFMTLKLKD
ncbi:MFS transporter [Sphingomonas canadensis]|uniref:MFS transporter n=1 Tax=Sphingomonas canadensis TaxID=1219257 RepID=A0ABW3H969_9SPHN|nr:MFS transporter [Sphingomonas canadensis]MCW3837556.1 MFS transporter [Sphingomonas canadensis]